MSEGWAAWLAGRRVQETPAQKLYRQAQQGTERQERAELAAEAERAAEREEERDRRLLAFQQLGIGGRTLGDIAEEASRAASEDDQYAEALKTIEKIDKRRARRAEAQQYQAEQLDQLAQRSASADPFEAARSEAHQAFLQATRARWAEAQVRAPERGRPFAIRGGAAGEEREITRVCGPGEDGQLRNYGPEVYR
jgi:hypothetical protein